MKFPDQYKSMSRQRFQNSEYTIVPIRFEDRHSIMKWRNEQIYHLRQSKPLTHEDQENYFQNIISKLFDEKKPNQILFSFLKENECIGYGGLVHINWLDKNAEISFIMDTELEEKEFESLWINYLSLIEEVAFHELGFNKIFTYAFDLRPRLYSALDTAGFSREAILRDQTYFNHNYIDVVIHCKFQDSVTLRKIDEQDIDFTYFLANDPLTRQNSYVPELIPYQQHKDWFLKKIVDPSAIYFIGEYNRQKAAFVRIDIKKENVIGIALHPDYRGKKLSSKFIKLISIFFKKDKSDLQITAYIKKENYASIKAFENAGFIFKEESHISGSQSSKYQL